MPCYNERCAPRCEGCCKPISSGKFLVYNERKYHSDCFRCGQCNKIITDNEFATHNAKPCCLGCCHDQFAPKCAQCLKAISYGDYINYDEKKYHPGCFRCNRCNKVIIDVKFPTHDSKPYCVQCHNEYFVSQCTQCLKPISIGQTLIVNEKKYHPECFRCYQCDKVITDREFHTQDGKLCCIQCYNKYLAPRCAKCSMPISNGQSTVFDEKKYHPECFRCYQCDKAITDREFHTQDGKLCCIQCYNKYLAPRCAKCSMPISNGQSTVFDGKKYHPECFRCYQCDKAITDREFHTQDGKLCCIQCYNKYLAPHCPQCFQPISVGRSIIFDKKTYHPECFRCFQCDTVITEQQFHTENGKPCCNPCYNEYFKPPRCSKCMRPIMNDYMTFQSKKFHIDCA